MIDNLINDIQDKNIPVSILLIKAKVIATKRKESEFLKWVELELNGHIDVICPEYRKISGQAKFWNPQLGWCPIVFGSSEIEKSLVNRSTKQSVGEIEQLLKSDSRQFEMPYPSDVAATIMEESGLRTKVSLFMDSSSLVGVLNKIRNLLLDWALKLDEKQQKIETKLEIKTVKKDISIKNDFLYFGTQKISIERGLKSMAELLLKNANIYRGDTLSKNGNPLEITKLIEIGGYKDETAFRDGLKRLRGKLKEAEIPATIENPTTGKYQLFIKYQ